MTAPFMEHAQANFYFHCGMPFTGFPSMGAWITYGLGTENQNLPGFVVLGTGGMPVGGVQVFGNGFLPAIHQGSLIYPEKAEPLHNVRPSESDQAQLARLSAIDDLDRSFLDRASNEPGVEAAIDNYEIAYRMQTAVPELTDLSDETEATRKLYGLDSSNASTAAYGKQCLVARRLVERGVRFVELTMIGNEGIGLLPNPWDQHTKLEEGHGANALTVDLFRLKSACASVYGQTDEYGYRVVENAHTVRDLHATVLHLLGLDYTNLTYRFGGRDFRLTDVDGHPIRGILA